MPFVNVQCNLCKRKIMISRDRYENNKKDKIYCSRKQCKKEQKERGLI
jgi:hypothetical protein